MSNEHFFVFACDICIVNVYQCILVSLVFTSFFSLFNQVAMKLVQRGKKMKQPRREATEHSDAEDQHKCNECGMVFQRRYALIMHTLKHERTKNYKCPVSLF